ncbi:MAG: redoxin domain-containing protein [Flavobacterium sp.]|nr:redoxin domain-containing protein [Flavobacterium sp.]
MNKLFALLVFSSLLFVSTSFKKPVDAAIGNFKLKSVTNQLIALSDYKTAKGFMIVFICNKCPMANLYTNRLNTLNLKYKNNGFPLLVINSMDTLVYAEESFILMQKKAKKAKFNFPYLQDKDQKIAKKFNATHTPQAFVITKNKLGKYDIKYQGAIDDNAGEANLATPDLDNALNELVQGKNVSKAVTESFGCRMFFRGEKYKM